MTLDELLAIADRSPSGEAGGIAAIAAPNSVLAIWTLSPMLDECCQLIRAWGFTLKSGLVWVKDKIGMGFWCRSRHQHLILASRGAPLIPVGRDRPDSVIESPRRGHSEKPDEVYAILERMFAGVPKVELFHRGELRPGWHTWGNE